MAERAYTDDDFHIRQVFEAAGVRLTGSRLALLHVMREQGGFLDAESWHGLAVLRGEPLSRATVYRTLGLSKALELVEGRLVGDMQDREEYRFRSRRDSYTLTCQRCGAIVPVEPEIIDAFRRDVARTLGVIVLTAHSCFIGYCAACTAALAREDESP